MKWPSAPLKRVADINRAALPDNTDPDHEIRYIDISAVGRGRLISDPQQMRFGDAPSRARRLVAPGDTIVSTVRTYLRAVLPIRGPTDHVVVSTGFAVVSPGRQMHHAFLSWYLQSDTFVDEVVARSNGVSYPAIVASDMGRIDVRVPPQAEQQAIADFLDAETARIDALIAKKRKLSRIASERLGVLARRKTTFEQRHLPMRRVVNQVKTGTTPSSDASSLIIDDGEVEWATPGDFDWLPRLSKAARRVSSEAVNEGHVPLFPAGAVLIVGIGATAGKVAYAERSVSSNQQVTALVPGSLIDGRFLGWQLWSRKQEIKETAPYTTLPILNNDFLRDLLIDLPERLDQIRIAEVLDGHAKLTATLMSSLERQISLLSEHRQALITAAVTGELDVAESISEQAL